MFNDFDKALRVASRQTNLVGHQPFLRLCFRLVDSKQGGIKLEETMKKYHENEL
jgi:hypothetical protein